jgi:MHS family proline/betaine transporter-like MFS transporter
MTNDQAVRTSAAEPPADLRDLGAQRRRAVVAGIIGNTLEWYDFGVYGFLATVLARQFFPASEQYVALLQTFGVFGVGFAARPLGALLMGRLGDILGRKAVLVLTILMMATGTIAIGAVPNYARIGIVAPIVLLFARVLQGLAAGGEWGNAAAFLAEWASTGRRGFYGGMLLASVSGGMLLGSGASALVSTLLTQQHLFAWGWRIPFLAGAALVPVGLYMRRKVEEPPPFRSHSGERKPLPAGNFYGLLLRASCLCLPLMIASYMATVYMPSYAELYGHLARSSALWSNTCALGLTVIAAPFVGSLSDRYGRRRLIIINSAALIVFSFPLYLWIASAVPFGTFLCIQLLLTIMVVGCNGGVPAAVAEIFRTSSRSTGAALANAIAGLLGGFAPLISTWLIGRTGSVVSPASLVVFAAAAALIAAAGMKETAHAELT